jgi:Fis family transcriptional regulator, factor for inversion stimulation protein
MKERFDSLVQSLLDGNIFMEEATEVLEKSMIEGVLKRTQGNQSAASKQLGIHRNTLQRKMVEYGLGNGRSRARAKRAANAGRARGRKGSAS